MDLNIFPWNLLSASDLSEPGCIRVQRNHEIVKSWPARTSRAQAGNLGRGRSSAVRVPPHQPSGVGLLSVKGALLFLPVQKVLPVSVGSVSELCFQAARCNLLSAILCIPSASI